MLFSPLNADFYQYTMAYGYWRTQKQNQEAIFHLHYRKNPFEGGYCIAAGLDTALAFLSDFRLDKQSIAFLRTQQQGNKPLFSDDFLEYLANLRLSVSIDAVAEGTLVFPYAPLLRIQGSLLECQLIESALVNIIGFQTLIATRAARLTEAANDEPILDFGMRRAHGLDAALYASRAAYIGGIKATSNVRAAQRFNIPAAGTHAHSWVMAFDAEEESFEAYANIMPERCILLVDTYDTLSGIDKAIQVAKSMQKQGKNLYGVRIDSGDLAYFGRQARKKLNKANLHDVKIIASGDLDEHLIENLKQQKACINAWGVGTKLACADGNPSLGAVCKLSAIKRNNQWQDAIKVSDSREKINIPGILQTKRFYKNKQMIADMIYDIRHNIHKPYNITSPKDVTKQKQMPLGLQEEDLLKPVFKHGKRVQKTPKLQQIQQNTLANLKCLDKTCRRTINPHEYPVGLEHNLHLKRTEMIIKRTK